MFCLIMQKGARRHTFGQENYKMLLRKQKLITGSKRDGKAKALRNMENKNLKNIMI